MPSARETISMVQILTARGTMADWWVRIQNDKYKVHLSDRHGSVVFHKNANPQTRALSPSKDSITFPHTLRDHVPTSEFRLFLFLPVPIIKITNIVSLTHGPTAKSSQSPLSDQPFLHVK